MKFRYNSIYITDDRLLVILAMKASFELTSEMNLNFAITTLIVYQLLDSETAFAGKPAEKKQSEINPPNQQDRISTE